jgi:hypothetical protein
MSDVSTKKCLVGEKRDGHRAFMAIIKSDARFQANKGYRFLSTVIYGHEAVAPGA